MKTSIFKTVSLFFICCFLTTPLWAQQVVTGEVKDAYGAPLPGAGILIKGSHSGTITDAEGQFKVQVPSDATLIVSYQGYQQKVVSVKGQSFVSIVLTESVSALEDVTITATRSKREIADVPQQVQVVHQAEIEQTNATDITNILKKTAGVDVIQYPGLLSGIGMRGFRPEYSGINKRSLLLINGRPAGTTNLATIGLDNVARIEVLKGPASALYGAQAMGGVVNVITKKTDGALRGQVSGALGSFGTTEGVFSVGGNVTSKIDFDLNFNSHVQGEDFELGGGNLFRDMFGSDKATRILWTEDGREEVKIDDTRGDGDVRPNTTYSSYTGSFRLGYALNDDWRIDFQGDKFMADDINSPGDIDDGSLSPGLKDLDRYGTDVSIQGALTDLNKLTVKAFHAKEATTNYKVSVDDSTYVRSQYVNNRKKLKWWGAQVMDRQQFGHHFVTVGLDYNKVTQDNHSFNSMGEASDVDAQSPNFDQSHVGVYAQGEFNFFNNKLNVTAGVRNETITYDITGTARFDARSETSNVTCPSIGVNWHVTPQISLHSTFGTAFTTVDIFEIAGYDEESVDNNTSDGIDTVDVYIGNPDLKNQESRTYDIGLRYVSQNDRVSADITYFRTALDNNVLSTNTQYPGSISESGAVIRNLNSYTNANSTTLSGIEWDANIQFNAGVNVFASGTYILKAEEISEIYGQSEPLTLDMRNVADLTINYGVDYQVTNWLATRLTGRYVGKRYDTDWAFYLSKENGYGAGSYADIRYPSFMTLDWMVSGHYKNYELSVLANNITDENYYEKRGYNLMGRNYMLRFKVSF